MEFRYRAIDIDRPRPPVTDMAPTQFPNPNSSFLPALSLAESGEVNSREAVQREIEKEQIRQEIIIAEATRKRELIAEVLKEMAIEREMAVRGITETGMSLEEKLTMLINQKKLPPNQNLNDLFRHMSTCTGPYNMQLPSLQQINEATERSSMESNKEKLIVLERADSVGAKRKAEDTETGLNGHVQEKKHKAKESASEAVEIEETVSSKPPSLKKLGRGKQVEESKLRKSFKFWCDICKVGAFSETVMRNHELGKKHKAAITTQQNESPEIIVEVQKVDEMSAKETGNKIEGGEKNMEKKFWCKICHIWTNSEKVMKTHKAGKKHKVLFEKQQSKPRVRSSSTDSGDKGSVDLTKGKVHCSDKS
ncbi:hypothetical protein V5N11_031784 [Cardamine amara subsp. amara]|uniref:U1-type domain-containing protein n=1 Tax=Cardamine amara subsp. amara TaxID=228776 RepID=A0ABD0ZYD3_CARAN